jgi:hypothetical protein
MPNAYQLTYAKHSGFTTLEACNNMFFTPDHQTTPKDNLKGLEWQIPEEAPGRHW